MNNKEKLGLLLMVGLAPALYLLTDEHIFIQWIAITFWIIGCMMFLGDSE